MSEPDNREDTFLLAATELARQPCLSVLHHHHIVASEVGFGRSQIVCWHCRRQVILGPAVGGSEGAMEDYVDRS